MLAADATAEALQRGWRTKDFARVIKGSCKLLNCDAARAYSFIQSNLQEASHVAEFYGADQVKDILSAEGELVTKHLGPLIRSPLAKTQVTNLNDAQTDAQVIATTNTDVESDKNIGPMIPPPTELSTDNSTDEQQDDLVGKPVSAKNTPTTKNEADRGADQRTTDPNLLIQKRLDFIDSLWSQFQTKQNINSILTSMFAEAPLFQLDFLGKRLYFQLTKIATEINNKQFCSLSLNRLFRF